MTGPENYKEAERLAERAYHYVHGDGVDVEIGAAFAAMAQVHATLALAAATAIQPADYGRGHPDREAWMQVAEVKAP